MIEFSHLLASAKPYAAVTAAIRIILTLPLTMCEVQGAYSSMRRLKSWLRATTTSERLPHLAILYVHSIRITSELIKSVVSLMAGGNFRRRTSQN
jgi:hypothetical protein